MSQTIQKKQLFLFGGLIAAGVTLLGFLVWSLEKDEGTGPDKQTPKTIETVGGRIDPQEVWVERLESEHQLTQKKMDVLEKMLVQNLETSAEAGKKYEAMVKHMDDDRRGPKEPIPSGSEMPASPSFKGLPTAQMLPFPPGEAASPREGALTPKPVLPLGFGKIVLKLSPRALPQTAAAKKATLENTIPAGTFAKATLLGGVDASTSITAQNDPRPVLLRIRDHGNLPRRFQSDLKACHVLASSYGDLSSERVYMRLEKLTCTERLTGEISETTVAGYIVGEDGRAGVRGVVADRAGPLIRNSLLGGFLSGMGQFLGAQQQRAVMPVMPFGSAMNPLTPEQMGAASAANGASTALSKYADFFIKRAEQLQPVLQVAAGRSVDIVFTQGTAFGDTTVRQTLEKIRNQSRKQSVSDLENKPDTGNWLPSVGDLHSEGNGS